MIPILIAFVGTLPAQVSAETKATITVMKPGDRWLDDVQYTRVARGQRDGTWGYEVTYELPGIGETVLFWPPSKIDLDNSTPNKYRVQILPLGKGRLLLPDRITTKSLPEVYRAILMLEGSYSKEARGNMVVAEAFATVTGLAAGLPGRAAAGVASRPAASSAATRAPVRPTVARPTTVTSTAASSSSASASTVASTARGGTSFGAKSLGAAQASIELTGKAKRILGGLRNLKDMTVREAIRARGGTAGVVRKAGDDFAGQFVGNVANAAAQGNVQALKVIKLIKDARRLGQTY